MNKATDTSPKITAKKVGRYLQHKNGKIMLTITTDGDGYGHVICCECGDGYFVVAPSYQWLEWIEGKVLIQNAFPEMDADTHELLISQCCPTCFKKLFSEDEDATRN